MANNLVNPPFRYKVHENLQPPFSYKLYKNVVIPPWNYEVWKDVTYPTIRKNAYMVSNIGRMYSKLKDTIMSVYTDKYGYRMISLVLEDGRRHPIHVGRLVCWEFNSQPENYNELFVNHIEPRPTFNHNQNLEWVTPQINVRHAAEKNLGMIGVLNGRAKLTEDQVRQICEYLSQTDYSAAEICKDVGLEPSRNNTSIINSISERKSWTHISKDYEFHDRSTNFFTEVEADNIGRLLKEGKSGPEILESIGVKKSRRALSNISKIKMGERYLKVVEKYGLGKHMKDPRFL